MPEPSVAVFQPVKLRPVRVNVPVFAESVVAVPAVVKLVVVYEPAAGAVPVDWLLPS